MLAGDELIDTRIPGGGNMYLMQRIDRKGPDGKTTKSLLCLGSGGFAATLDGIRVLPTERVPVAIKQVSVGKRSADTFEKYELRGIESVSSRSHPNLVKFLTYFRGDDGDGNSRLNFVFERCPLAMPYLVPAETTSKGFLVPSPDTVSPDRVGCDLLNNSILMPPMRAVEARHIIRQVLSALAYLHSQMPQIIHRDVKPGNVLVWGSTTDEAGNKLLTVKLTDYGTVRRMDTRDMTVGQGTRAFMAPEVDVQTGTSGSGTSAKPIGSYDTSVDVFSAGATFFYLITAQTPDGNTRRTWQQRFGSEVAVTPVVDPATGQPSVSLPPDVIVAGMMPTDGMSLFEMTAQKAQQASKQAGAASGGAGSGDGASGGAGGGLWGAPASPTNSSGRSRHRSHKRHQSNDLLSRLARAEGASSSPKPESSPKLARSPSADGAAAAATDAAAPLPSRTSSSAASAGPTKLPQTTLLDFYFPPGSPQRLFLQGLLHRAPAVSPTDPGPMRRWTAAEAIAWLDANWK